MPRKRFTNEQIAFALRQAENGATVDCVSACNFDPLRRGIWSGPLEVDGLDKAD